MSENLDLLPYAEALTVALESCFISQRPKGRNASSHTSAAAAGSLLSERLLNAEDAATAPSLGTALTSQIV